jgi:hypothetical protein
MTLSTLQKFLLPPVIASAAVFTAMSTPLAMQGDKQIDIRWEQEPFFSGRLRDVSTLYVVAATALSIGAGISAASVCGWRHSARKSSEIKLELSSLEQNLQQKEELLRELKLSDNRLQLSGLSSFLDDGVPFEQALNTKKITTSVSQPVVAQTPAPIQSLAVNSVPLVVARQNTNRINTSTSAASAFASAQNAFGYAHNSSNRSQETTVASQVSKTTITASDFEEMQKQLREEMRKQFQEMMLQMQSTQNHRQLMPQAINTAATVSDKFSVYYEAPSTSEVRFK